METIQCERCGRECGTKDIIVCVKNGCDITFLCRACNNLIGYCPTCENYTTCNFLEDPDPLPQTVVKEKRINTPMGVMVHQQQVPNGERIKKFCLEGKCLCANEQNSEGPFCCRHTEYKTCGNYKEKNYTLSSE